MGTPFPGESAEYRAARDRLLEREIEFVVRSYLHRARLGDGRALEAARLMAVEMDNPALHELVAGLDGRVSPLTRRV